MRRTSGVELGELLAFELYMRSGLRLPPETVQAYVEFKSGGNPYHDPKDGRFTFRPGGGVLPPRRISENARLGPVSDFMRWIRGQASPTQNKVPSSKPSPSSSPAPVARRNYSIIGALSAKHESRGKGDPGAVSSGKNDPGGVSYGKHQYSSSRGIAAQFVRSPEAARWASEFRGLAPGTERFSVKWREIAARDSANFGNAQDAFTGRSHYEEKVRGVLRHTGFNLDRANIAVQQAAFSVSVQHGGAERILRDAVLYADRQARRTDSGFEAALIRSIYDRRIAYVARLRDQARAQRRLGDAQTFDNIIKNRYRLERAEALQLLAAGVR